MLNHEAVMLDQRSFTLSHFTLTNKQGKQRSTIVDHGSSIMQRAALVSDHRSPIGSRLLNLPSQSTTQLISLHRLVRDIMTTNWD